MKLNLSVLRKIKAIGLNTVRQVLTSVFSITIPFIVISYSKEEVWGEFVTYLLFVLIISQLINFGNKEFLLRTFSKKPNKIINTFTSVFFTRLPLTLILSAIGFLFFDAWLIGYIFIWSLGQFLSHSFETILIYEKKFSYSIIIEVLFFTLLVLAFILYKSNFNIYILIVSYSIYQLCKGLSYFTIFYKYINLKKISINFKYFKISFWFFLLSILGFLTNKTDLYIVDMFLNKKTLSNYQIINSLLVFTMSLSAYIFIPFVKNIYRIKRKTILKIKKLLFLCGLIVSIFCIVIVYYVATYFLNTSYSLYFYLIAFFYILPCFAYGIDILMLFKKGKEKTVVLYLFYGVVINTITSILLLNNNFDIIGALVGGTTAQLLILVLLKRNSFLHDCSIT